VAVDAKAGRVFMTNTGSNSVGVDQGTAGALIGSMAVDGRRGHAFVANGVANSVSVLDMRCGRTACTACTRLMAGPRAISAVPCAIGRSATQDPQ
jgi:hypothetical protein